MFFLEDTSVGSQKSQDGMLDCLDLDIHFMSVTKRNLAATFGRILQDASTKHTDLRNKWNFSHNLRQERSWLSRGVLLNSR